MLAWPTRATNAVIGDPITVAVAGAPSARRLTTRVVAGFASRQSYSEMQYPNSSMCIRKPLSAVRSSAFHLDTYIIIFPANVNGSGRRIGCAAVGRT